MRSFSLNVDIKKGLGNVFETFWRVQEWPHIASHVREIRILYEDDCVQVVEMEVEAHGRHDRFETVRMRTADAIHFFQPNPPAGLRFHRGSWWFEDLGAGSQSTRVTSTHEIEIGPFEAAKKGSATLTSEQELIQLISRNSMQTMMALKRLAEQEVAHAPLA